MDSVFCYSDYEPIAKEDGWYRVALLSDTAGDYDRTTFCKTGGNFGLDNHYFERDNPTDPNSPMLLRTSGDFGNMDLFRSAMENTNTLHADKIKNMLPTGLRCQVQFDTVSRTWARLDASEYYVYKPEPNEINSKIVSCSLGVSVGDPRFLVTLTPKNHYDFNVEGEYPEYPKNGYIWLFRGESISDI